MFPLPVVFEPSAPAPVAVFSAPVVLLKSASCPSAVSAVQLVQLLRAPVPSAVLKLGLALLVVIVPPGCAGAAAHDCTAVNTPLEQDVAEPTRLKPTLQENEQLLPEARVPGQLPRVPFAGGDTAHEFAAFTEIGMLSKAAARQQIIVDFNASFDAKGA